VAEKTSRKPQTNKRKKKTWASPRVKSGRLFESNSLACSKDKPDGQMCSADAGMS
jgi:hypothetical protein